MSRLPDLKIQIYADGADFNQILRMYRSGIVKGFTTNPTLMAKAGITNYQGFAKKLLAEISDMPISFEVFSDDFDEMLVQARKIASWGKNVNVKIPITDTKGQSAMPLIKDLIAEGIKLNITAVFTEKQLLDIKAVLTQTSDAIVSIFAGRIADSGIDPQWIMTKAVAMFGEFTHVRVLWASPREVLNIYQADQLGVDIITATPDLIDKLSCYGKDLSQFSLETVQMFYQDAQRAGFSI